MMRSFRVTGSLVGLCILLTGCSTMSLVSNASSTNPTKKFVKATPHNPAVKCLCVWQAAEGYDAQGKPCRGVAGQVFFFSAHSDLPVMVDGDVRVFVFDDQGSEADQIRPLSHLDIDRQAWNAQLTSTQFGPAYRLFVPYARPGRHQAQVGVRLRMTPDSGPAVFSDLSTIELAGSKPEKIEKSAESPTTAKVERALREQLGGDRQTASSGSRSPADAESQAVNRRAATTIATIRTTAGVGN